MKRILILLAALVFSILASGCFSEFQQGKIKRTDKQKIRFVTLTNGTVLQGEVELPLEIKLKSFDGIFLSANGAPGSSYSVRIQTNSVGRWFLDWNTQNYPNGIYDIYLEADSGDDSYFSVTNTIMVSNMVSFDPFPFFGSYTQMWIFARLAVQNADWKVKMFDGKDKYIGYFVGSTTNGFINFFWDCTDTNGKTFTNEEAFRTDVSITTPDDRRAPLPTNHPNLSLSNTPPLEDKIPHKLIPPEKESK
jgi:hypothetical protein